MKKVIGKFYKTKELAEKEARRLNELRGKQVYIVLENKEKWIVLHVNQLL